MYSRYPFFLLLAPSGCTDTPCRLFIPASLPVIKCRNLVLGAWKIIPFEIRLWLLCRLVKHWCFSFLPLLEYGLELLSIVYCLTVSLLFIKSFIEELISDGFMQTIPRRPFRACRLFPQKSMKITWCLTAIQDLSHWTSHLTNHHAGLEEPVQRHPYGLANAA